MCFCLLVTIWFTTYYLRYPQRLCLLLLMFPENLEYNMIDCYFVCHFCSFDVGTCSRWRRLRWLYLFVWHKSVLCTWG